MKIHCHNFIFGQERLAKRRGVLAFTLIEVLIALSIFALIITGIYSSCSGLPRATRIGLQPAAGGGVGAGDSHREGHGDLRAAGREFELAGCGDEAFGDDLRADLVGVGEEGQDPIAEEATQEVAGAGRGDEETRDLLEDVVLGLVAVEVAEGGDAVHTDDEHHDLVAVALGARELLVHQALELFRGEEPLVRGGEAGEGEGGHCGGG